MKYFNGRKGALADPPWWAAPRYIADTLRPALVADFCRNRYMINGQFAEFKNIINLSSVGKWVINQSGILAQTPANNPAFDYSTGRARLVLEGASTNVFLNSATGVTQVTTLSSGSYTLSFYGTGSIVLTGTASGSLVGTGTNNRVKLTVTATAGACTATVTGSCANVQFEAQSFASSYIPTTSAAVTRTADSAQLTTAAAALLQASAASVVVRGRLASASGGRILGLDSLYALLGAQTDTGAFSYSRSSQYLAAASGYSFSSGFGVSTGFNVSGRSLVLNGGVVASDANTFSGITSVYLSRDQSGDFVSGDYDELVIWPSRLTNTSLQSQARVWQ